MNKLVSSRGAAAILGIKVNNMGNQRKAIGFPAPVMIVDETIPLWLESDIVEWSKLPRTPGRKKREVMQ